MTQTALFDQLPPLDGLTWGPEACGADLEYTPAFLELASLAAGKQEQQVGDVIHQAEEPDWSAVLRHGLALLAASRDIRVATLTARAATHQHGLPGLTEILEHIAAWLQNDWANVHPALVIDGEFDPLLRANAVAALADPDGLMRSLRTTALLATPTGKLTLGDIEAILLGRPVGERAPVSNPEQLQRLLSSESAASQEALGTCTRALAALRTIDETCRRNSTPDTTPDLQAVLGLLDRVAKAIPANAAEAPAESTEFVPLALQGEAPPAPGAANLPGVLRTRAEAFRALAVARNYFECNEPSHPAPLLIKRIERLADLDFAAMIAELAPDGMNQLRQITGTDHT